MPTISAVGAKFFFSNGTQYYIKGKPIINAIAVVSLTKSSGVAYQLTSLDPLTNATQCMLDAASMADLGANTIRVYHVDSTADHDACMSAFASFGIYLFLDLDTFDTQFNQASQALSMDTSILLTFLSTQALPAWNQTQLSAFEAVLDAFEQYDNLAGVFVANEALTFRQ